MKQGELEEAPLHGIHTTDYGRDYFRHLTARTGSKVIIIIEIIIIIIIIIIMKIMIMIISSYISSL